MWYIYNRPIGHYLDIVTLQCNMPSLVCLVSVFILGEPDIACPGLGYSCSAQGVGAHDCLVGRARPRGLGELG